MDRRAWARRPGLSLLIAAAVLVVPLLLGVVAVKAAVAVTPRPDRWWLFDLWVGFLIWVSIAATHAAYLLTRRLSPLSDLFRLSLVFPDEAPSRFRTAIRSRTIRTLTDADAGASSPEQAAAEDLVCLVTRLSDHDRLTRGHSEWVSAYSVMLGEEIGLSDDDLDELNWAALIHDIGKLEMP